MSKDIIHLFQHFIILKNKDSNLRSIIEIKMWYLLDLMCCETSTGFKDCSHFHQCNLDGEYKAVGVLLSLSCSARQHSALSRSKKERTEKQTACLRGGEASPRSLSPANCLRKFTLSVKLHLFWRNSIYRSVAEGPHLHMHGLWLWQSPVTHQTTALSERKTKENTAA